MASIMHKDIVRVFLENFHVKSGTFFQRYPVEMILGFMKEMV